MAQPHRNAMDKDLNDSAEWDVFADDWVVIGEEIDANNDPDQAKSKNELNIDHVTSPVVAKNEKENPFAPKVVTRYVDVPEDMIRFFNGKDVVMDIQISTGAMIQITEARDVGAFFRPVRMIGNSRNVDMAEELIKAVVALGDAGGSVLLRKSESDSGDDRTRNEHYQKQLEAWYRSRDSLQYPKQPWYWYPDHLQYSDSWDTFQLF